MHGIQMAVPQKVVRKKPFDVGLLGIPKACIDMCHSIIVKYANA